MPTVREVLTSRPTTERSRHAAGIEAPLVNGVVRRWWTVNTRLDGLLAGKLIDQSAFAAAQAFAGDFAAIGALPGSSWGRLGLPQGQRGSAGDVHGRALRRAKAAARLRAIRERLGAPAYALAIAVVIEDTPWLELGRRLGCSGGRSAAGAGGGCPLGHRQRAVTQPHRDDGKRLARRGAVL